MTQFISQTTKGDDELALLMNAIQNACKVVAHSIRKAGIAGLYGSAATTNSTGDDVKKLDLIANDIWVSSLKNSGVCGILVSEENEEPIIISDPEAARRKSSGGYGTGRSVEVPLPVGRNFCVAFDPLDGSSNIDCNVSVGSIFSVYRKISNGTPELSDILRPGNEILAAGYAMYGAATEMVLTYGKGVHRFGLDPAVGEFVWIEDIKIPEGGGKKIYSCNEGNVKAWDEPIKKFVQECKANSYAARYVGSMVSDIHRTLLYGGIFLYPADTKSKKGKLRVLYEGFPMAMITEQAGGVASTGLFDGKVRRILDIVPADIHDKCPIIMGASRDVDRLLTLVREGLAGS